MRISTPAFAILLALALASPAAAQLRLSWGDCLPPAGLGLTTQTFACNTNTAVFNLYGSVIAPSGTVGIVGEAGTVDMQSDGTDLPAWWQFVQAGSCRSSGLSVGFSMPPESNCMTDYFDTIGIGPLGTFTYDWGGSAAGITGNRARLKTASAVDGSLAQPLTAGAEIYLFTVMIRTTSTVGDGACAGCQTPVAFIFDYLQLAQNPGVGDFFLSTPENYVSWRCPATLYITRAASARPAGAAFSYFGFDCTTPAHSKTWGQVKALYR